MKKQNIHYYCPTVSVGISAYNESATIVQIVGSLLQQRGDFIFERLHLYTDGSTDDTPEKVRILAKLFPMITAVIDSEQRGKAYRLNQLFQVNSSDILIIIDADILLIDAHFIHKLTRPFRDKLVGIVSSNNQYLSSGTFFSSIVAASEELWYHARKNSHGGDNFYNNSGSAVALNTQFTQQVKLPANCVDDQHVLYYLCVTHGFTFSFVKQAVSFCVAPGTLRDILVSHQRSQRESNLDGMISQTLGKRRKIGWLNKCDALVFMIIHKPLRTILAVFYLLIIRFSPISVDSLTRKGLWLRLASTKQTFTSAQLTEATSISRRII